MRVLVAGGGGAGMLTALLLARDGHAVTLVERDPPPAGPAHEAVRARAPQLVQPHVLLPLFRLLLRHELPDVASALLDAGAAEAPLANQLPPTITDRSERPGDDELTLLLTRRSVLDVVLLAAVRAQPGLDARFGTAVRGLCAATDDPSRIVGARTDDGDEAADVVVDATGRRSPIDGWLRELGHGPVVRESAPCGVAYYSRHYRLTRAGALPGTPRNRVVAPLPRLAAGFWGADGDTMLLGLCPLAEDRELRGLRDPERFTAVAADVPMLAAWLDVLEPISPVFAMGGIDNVLCRPAVGVRGLHAVGDSVASTNPTLARGLGMALRLALELRAALREHPGRGAGDADARAEHLARGVDTAIAPYYADQAAADAARLDRVRPVLRGEPAPPAPPPDPARLSYAELATIGARDPDAYRALCRLKGMLADPDATYTDPALLARRGP